MVERVKVLVSSPDGAIEGLLKDELDTQRFVVAAVQPGGRFLEVARRECPDVAVIDRVHERRAEAQMEIAILRDIRPEVRVIAVSEESSLRDAEVVEMGLFYYTAAATGPELVQAVVAAARDLA